MTTAYVCDGIRTPFGRYGGALSKVRADDLAAIPIKALMARHPDFDWSAVDEVVLGCGKRGLAALCIGVGQGAALAFERV